jgi:hypothetical protein
MAEFTVLCYDGILFPAHMVLNDRYPSCLGISLYLNIVETHLLQCDRYHDCISFQSSSINNEALEELRKRLIFWSQNNILKNKIVLDLSNSVLVIVDDCSYRLLELDCISFLRLAHLHRRAWTAEELKNVFIDKSLNLLDKLILWDDEPLYWMNFIGDMESFKSVLDQSLIDFKVRYPNVAKEPPLKLNHPAKYELKDCVMQYQRCDPNTIDGIRAYDHPRILNWLNPQSHLYYEDRETEDDLIESLERLCEYVCKKLKKKKEGGKPVYIHDLIAKYFFTFYLNNREEEIMKN